MNLGGIDWLIVFASLFGAFLIALYSSKYNRSVSDFLSASRCAGRFLLSISFGVAGTSLVSTIAYFEMYYSAGFTANWWGQLAAPAGIIAIVTGWCIYRYRETRALTTAQFLEIRYSRKFRVFAGIVSWVSGMINFGIHPAVCARFFIYFCGLPETIPGTGLSTQLVLMAALLLIAMFFVFIGGQIAIMVTDFSQGVFVMVGLLIIGTVLFTKFDWSVIVETVKAAPEQASLINPIHTQNTKGFNFFYFLLLMVLPFHGGGLSWPGSQGYGCAAKSAHEAKMATFVGAFRGMLQYIILILIPIIAYAIMHNARYSTIAGNVNNLLSSLNTESLRTQMLVPTVLAKLLPVGLMGLFVAMMLCTLIASWDTMIHSWAAIFIQDVVMPFRKTPLSPKAHLKLLKLAVVGVAVLSFLLAVLIKQTEYLWMYIHLSGAIYIAGGGTVITLGLYWKRGTAAAAWAAMIVGIFIAAGGFIVQQLWAGHLYPWMSNNTPDFLINFTNVVETISKNVPGINWEVKPDVFPFEGIWLTFFALIGAYFNYVLFSLTAWLFLKRPAFNIERMLHRGEYAIKTDHKDGVVVPPTGWKALLPSKEFTKVDKFVYYFFLGWSLVVYALFLVLTGYSLFIKDLSDNFWVGYWTCFTVLVALTGVAFTVWILIGGIRDVRSLFRDLNAIKINDLDDGRVVNHENVADKSQITANK
ncbi:MAG: hypothetical protein A2Y12_03290 [Planctomycetes bacterium GWF2_42_9]|nr:MAG: hypothetical protein A2Y12_03290 [Planctomycetes bacterium GWF2_42_9]